MATTVRHGMVSEARRSFAFDRTMLRLIAITGGLGEGVETLVHRAQQAVAGGATMVQLRLKDESAHTVVEVARVLLLALPGVPVLVNDRADVALAAGADGVHVGTEDIAPAALRRVVPSSFIIGASVGDESESARATGADYVGIGPVYATASKSDAGAMIGVSRFAELMKCAGLPAVAIGGVAPDNVRAVMESGASGIAAISALFGVTDPERAAREFRAGLDASGR